MEISAQVKLWKERFKAQAAFMALVVGGLWLLKFIDGVLPEHWSLQHLGVRPRQIPSLLCLPFAPLVHRDSGHLASNSVPIFVLGWLVLLSGPRRFLGVTVAVAAISGMGIWLFGKPNSSHIGASGIIFGYLGFLLARGWFERKILSVSIALIVAIFYGLMLLQLLVVKEQVSWSGHFFGFAGGIAAAWWMFHRNKLRPQPLAAEWDQQSGLKQ
jgi:membrane associated rhomboid family serine protease